MATVTDIVDDIKADLTLNGSDYDASIVRAVQSALRELRGKRYWFLETYGTLTATASSETLLITDTYTNFGAIKSLDLNAQSRRHYNHAGFDQRSFDDLRALYWSDSTIATGQPVAWAIVNKTLYFSHKCASAYSLPIVYYKQDATLPGAGGTSVWFDEGYDAVKARAQYIFKRNTQGMMATEADWDMVLLAEKSLGETHINMTSGDY